MFHRTTKRSVKLILAAFILLMPDITIGQVTDMLASNRLDIENAMTELKELTAGELNQVLMKKLSDEIDLLFNKRDSILVEYKNELNLLEDHLSDSTVIKKLENDSSIYHAYADFLRQSHIEDIAEQKQSAEFTERWAYKKYLREKINNYYKSKIQDSVSFRSKSTQEFQETYDKWQMETHFTDSLNLVYNSIKESLGEKAPGEVKKPEVKPISERVRILRQRYNRIRRSVVSVSGSGESSHRANTFEQKRGFHKWPLTNAELVLRFGYQKDKESGDSFSHPGIKIHSENDNLVKSIFEGTVVDKIIHGTDDYSIVVKHPVGYYSVYSGLSFSNLNIGDNIKTQQVIGLLPSFESGYSLQLQLWKDKRAINPIHYLKNRS